MNKNQQPRPLENNPTSLRSKLKVVIWSCTVPVILAIVAWITFDIAAGIQLRRSIVAWREASLPVHYREAVPDRPPIEENAAAILYSIIPMESDYRVELGGHSFSTRARMIRNPRPDLELERGSEIAAEILELLASQTPVPEAKIAELETILSETTLDYRRKIAREAVERERFDPHLEYELGYHLIVDYVTPMRSLGRLLRTEAVFHAVQENWDKAFNALAVNIRIAFLLTQEPTIISSLTASSILNESLETLETLFRIQSPGASARRELLEATGTSSAFDLSRTLRLEAIASKRFALGLLEGDIDLDNIVFVASPHPPVFWQYQQAFIFRPLRKADAALFLDRIRLLNTRMETANDREARLQEISALREELEATLPRYAFLSEIGLEEPYLEHILVTKTITETRLLLARTALAAHRYRETHGDWPESIDDLLPHNLREFPRDPFGTGTLNYVRDNTRVLLYGIGPDQSDDKGHPMENLRSDEPGDILWVLEEFGTSDPAR